MAEKFDTGSTWSEPKTPAEEAIDKIVAAAARLEGELAVIESLLLEGTFGERRELMQQLCDSTQKLTVNTLHEMVPYARIIAFAGKRE